MTDRFVVAFDVGTSGVKAVLADLGGRVVASRYEPYGLRALAAAGSSRTSGRSTAGSGPPAGPCWSAPASAPGCCSGWSTRRR